MATKEDQIILQLESLTSEVKAMRKENAEERIAQAVMAESLKNHINNKPAHHSYPCPWSEKHETEHRNIPKTIALITSIVGSFIGGVLWLIGSRP